MCIAAIALEGGFSEDELLQFFMANRDGGGFSYAEDGKVININHITDSDEYIAKGLELQTKTNLVTHCRIATMGAVDESNSHPFQMGEEEGSASLVHNGSLFYDSTQAYAKGKSDTRIFVDAFGKYLNKKELMTPEVVSSVGRIIGSYNKFILLYPDNDFIIINEKQGLWNPTNTKWYSNSWWQRVDTKPPVHPGRWAQGPFDDDY